YSTDVNGGGANFVFPSCFQIDEYYAGGAILNNNENLYLKNVVITNSNASDSGGAIASFGGDLKLQNLTLSNHHAGDGGGGLAWLYCGDAFGTIQILNSDITGNSTTGYSNYSDAGGGGILIETVYSVSTENGDFFGSVTIDNTQIDHNEAYYGTGG